MKVGIAKKRPGRSALQIGSWYFGVEHSTIAINDRPYMTRWILYFGPIGFRLHKFYRGDDDRAPHDHPFWFITIPLGQGYYEKVYNHADRATRLLGVWVPRFNYVPAWRPQFRGSDYKHIVVGTHPTAPSDPFWTFCIFGFVHPGWGFWPTPGEFIPWQEWK